MLFGDGAFFERNFQRTVVPNSAKPCDAILAPPFELGDT
jgi:hypothetical protein